MPITFSSPMAQSEVVLFMSHEAYIFLIIINFHLQILHSFFLDIADNVTITGINF